MSMTNENVIRIYLEVLAKVPAPDDEPAALAKLRRGLVKEVEKARAKGWVAEVPYD